MPLNILIADDDPLSRRVLEATLRRWGFGCTTVENGAEAWEVLQGATPPRLVILDWMMPKLDGIQVVRRLREGTKNCGAHVILLTCRASRSDVVRGLEAGADDYITKPFDPSELRARVQVGVRVLALQDALAGRVAELEEALSSVKRLQGLLPICSYCKKIRDDRNYWQQVEAYISEHSEAAFSHGICPDCYSKVAAAELDAARSRQPTG
ncbi:MAG TPA: response regulator transcription factor [Terriglobia bacterium]|nr:response regulator transcription factor [Terriglobia bacterium]